MTESAVAQEKKPTAGAGVETLRNYVGGRWVESRTRDFLDVYNPARGEVIAKTPLSTGEDLDAAVAAAKKAFSAWRDTPAVTRARTLFKFKALLEEHFEELARIVTTEHGKTLDESRGSVRRGIECVEVACGSPSLMMGYGLENIASGIDCTVIRQPVGVCAAIAPFNFPAMVPLWFLPFAVGTGNCIIVKPSEQVPLSMTRMFQLLEKCDLPPGVVSLVNGSRAVVEAICDHPDIRAVSFVGSTPVARAVYQRATHAGKRVQALGGAKNFIVVMPDADLDRSIGAITESFYGCAGERCLAGSVLVPVGEAHKQARERMVASAGALRVGDGAEPGVAMGPVIRAQHRDKVVSYIEKGVAEGAKLVLDGRNLRVPEREKGFFVGPTVFDGVSPSMAIGRDEIFGPVASITPVKTLEEAIAVMHAHPNANATSIFTSSGKTAREFARLASASMVGVNIGVAAPMAYFPFGGAKDSFFGDLKVHGRDTYEFYTDKKVVISRWF
jgi:malonate-semialdehyde dehydrogenase (acetylating) / methylmalonate-semialdehyde dehydrogenase